MCQFWLIRRQILIPVTHINKALGLLSNCLECKETLRANFWELWDQRLSLKFIIYPFDWVWLRNSEPTPWLPLPRPLTPLLLSYSTPFIHSSPILEPLPSFWKFPSSPFYPISLSQHLTPSLSPDSRSKLLTFLKLASLSHPLLSPSPQTPSRISHHSFADKLPVPSGHYWDHTRSLYFLTSFFSKGFICGCENCPHLCWE